MDFIRKKSGSLGPFITYLISASYYTKRLILLIADTFFLSFSLWAAVSLRLEEIWPPVWEEFFWLFPAVPFITLPVFVNMGLYRAVIRYTGLDSIWTIFKASYAAFFLLLGLLLVHGFDGFPRSTPLIYFFFVFLLLGGSRLLFRTIYFRLNNPKHGAKRILIYGAGSSGRQMVTAFQNSTEFIVVGFIDDSPSLHKRKLNGISIFSAQNIPGLIEKLGPNEILLAMPSVTKKRKKEILHLLEPLPVEVKSLPSLEELVSNDINISDIQEIGIEDLLGRDSVPPRMELIHSPIAGKNVMVTGAGGSIGSELCRQIAENNPSRLVLFDNSEFALYSIETELKTKFGAQVEIIPILGSVCRKKRVLAALRSLQINTVYHAAAYKHVPMVEHNPFEGIRNNVSGTLRTAEAAIESGVDTFVFISTDKAVRPTNIMGASKRIAEIILQAFTERGATTRFTMVRFGNVLDSSGSVVPLFRQQIKTGGPVTVTHHDVVRYFMTIPEAVQLVLQAAGMGKGGDVFVLDMGEPVRILDMAKKMIRLSGLTVRDNENPAGDIAIEFTGLRPGEKLFEELLIGDNVIGTEHPMIMRAKENFLPWNELKQLIDEIEETCLHYDYDKLRALLQKTVSGYLPHKEHVDPLWQMDSQNTANSPTKKRSSIQWLKKSLRV